MDDTEGDPLTEAERTILDMVAAGRSHAIAGAVVSRGPKTVQRLMQRSEAQRYVAERQSARREEVVGILTGASVKAAQALEAALDADNLSVRLRAAQLILSQVGDRAVLEETKRTLEALEHDLTDLRARLEADS